MYLRRDAVGSQADCRPYENVTTLHIDSPIFAGAQLGAWLIQNPTSYEVGFLPSDRTAVLFFLNFQMYISNMYFQGIAVIGRMTHRNV